MNDSTLGKTWQQARGELFKPKEISAPDSRVAKDCRSPMTDNEKKFKAAFLTVLRDFQNYTCDVDGKDETELSTYCKDVCPFKDNCPVLAAGDEHYLDVDCDEEIFKWYLNLLEEDADDE